DLAGGVFEKSARADRRLRARLLLGRLVVARRDQIGRAHARHLVRFLAPAEALVFTLVLGAFLLRVEPRGEIDVSAGPPQRLAAAVRGERPRRRRRHGRSRRARARAQDARARTAEASATVSYASARRIRSSTTEAV